MKQAIESQRAYFLTGQTKSYQSRYEALKKLKAAIKANEEAILAALRHDLNKSDFEAYATEIGITLEEINFTLKHVKHWMKDKKVRSPFTQFPSKTWIKQDPYGHVLIIAPWNYPFQLAIAPLVGAIAAGNVVTIKPSEHALKTQEVINDLIQSTFDSRYVNVILGDVSVNQALLNEKFDYIFFTGSTAVGKIVMEKAAKLLTPVTLELGGKSPLIVDETAHLDLAAKRIVWGKFINAGQTCVAPDYVYVHSSVKASLITKMQHYITRFYGQDPITHKDYPKIINQNHFTRLLALLKDETVSFGGSYDVSSLKITPTLLEHVTWESKVMQEEIFGPILPIMSYSSLDELVGVLQTKPKPLALYVFTTKKAVEDKILNALSFGGGAINDTIVHLVSPHLPFGGVGESGMGHYHGKYSFKTFSHQKSILKKSNRYDMPLRYPTHHKYINILKFFMK